MLLKFDVSVFEEDIYQEITFGEPIGKTFKLKTEQTGTFYELTKSGKPDAQINTTYIDWTVDVNTKLESLTNGSVEDSIPAGLTIDPTSVKIYELIVGSKGKLTKGNEVTKSYTIDGDVLKVELSATDKAYRIKFKTNIDGKLNNSYTNTATLKDNGEEKASAPASVEGLTRGSSIEKQGWQNTNDKDQIIWRIYVNKAEDTLKGVKILDSLPAGLTLVSIDYSKSDAAGNYGAYVGNATEFPLELGDITGAYVIEVISKIDYAHFENYTKELTFENTAKLEVEGEVIDDSTDKVTIARGSILEKSGKETTSYGDSKITWTLNVNKAKHTIKGATITDIIGAGLELLENSLVVKNVTKDTTPAASDYTFTKTAGGFTINLGDITDEYTITYDTKITKALAEGVTGYSNKGKLTGTGGLEGAGTEDIEKDIEVKPTVSNSYNKIKEENAKVDGITYDGLNYLAKTMSWIISVNAIKEEVTELTITDFFLPDKTMKLIPGTLRVVVGSGTGDILTQGTDYLLKDNGVGGFEIEFIGNHIVFTLSRQFIFCS